MPWIRIDLPPGRADDQKARVAETVTKAMVDICNCTPESVSIVFSEGESRNWAFAGTLLSRK